MSGSLAEKAEDEWGAGSKQAGRLHVEAFQDTSDVVGLRQKQLSFGAIPTNLHSEDVPCQTEVLHCKLQPQFPNEFGELCYPVLWVSTFDILHGYRDQGIAMCEGLVQGSVVK